MKTLITLLTLITLTIFNNPTTAQTLELDCIIENTISEDTQILLVNKTEGDIRIYNSRNHKIKPVLDMGYDYELVFQSDNCATKVIEFNLSTKDNILNDAKFDFKVVMIPAKSPEEIIRAGVITYVQSSKEFAYIVTK